MRAEGLQRVTMRRLAAELDTGPASLYAHVANKKELDQLMLDRAAADMKLPDADPEHWQEQLKAAMDEILRVMRAYPGLARAAIGQVPLGEYAMLSTERMLATAASAFCTECRPGTDRRSSPKVLTPTPPRRSCFSMMQREP